MADTADPPQSAKRPIDQRVYRQSPSRGGGSDEGFWWWRGRDLNPRPSGYEFAKAYIGECRFVPENAVELLLCLMNVSACPCG